MDRQVQDRIRKLILRRRSLWNSWADIRLLVVDFFTLVLVFPAPLKPRVTVSVPDKLTLNSSSSITVTPTDVERDAAITLALYRSDNCSGNSVTMLDHAQLGNDLVTFPITFNTQNILGSVKLLDMSEPHFLSMLPNISFTIGVMWADINQTTYQSSASSARKIFCSSPFVFRMANDTVIPSQLYSTLDLPPTSENALVYPLDLFSTTATSVDDRWCPLWVSHYILIFICQLHWYSYVHPCIVLRR